NQQRRLRTALYATAAIPSSESELNEALRTAIIDLRQQHLFVPPGATQTWALAVNPNNKQEAAIGDDNGVVWLVNTDLGTQARNIARFGAQSELGTPALTASNGVVNSIAFSSDGSFLAAAYRNSTVAVWDDRTKNLHCLLQLAGSGGSYGV